MKTFKAVSGGNGKRLDMNGRKRIWTINRTQLATVKRAGSNPVSLPYFKESK